jgi:autotransporter-associated beta strand protein
VSVSANAGTGTGTITMNGGNLVLSKGIGSAGIYSGLDMANTISVLADTTITLDPNPLTPTESNLASAALLQSKASKTITVAKSSTANAGAQMVFKSAELEGTTTFNVADATQVALGGGTSTGGVTKTGIGTLVLSVLDSTTSAIVNNTYTGTTAINAGTVSFYPGSSQASSISVANNAVAQFSLGDATPTTSGSLTLSSGSKVRISGTPINGTSYTLFTAAGGIIGTPTLETPISLYSLKKSTDGNSLILEFAKITPTITVTPSTYTYSGSMQGPGVDEVSKGGSQGLITLSYAGTGSTTYSSSTPPTNAGNYTVTATVSADATYSQASSAATAFTIAKATPTVSVAPTASAVTVGATLSSSILSGGTASVAGTYAWTTPSTVLSASGPYLVTFNPTDSANYNTASTSASVTANPAGTTYSTWLSGNGGTASDAAFLNYVFGAVTAGSLDASLKPTVAVTGGNLVLTYNVRQGTVGLTVTAQTSADLATGAAGWGTSGITDVAVGTPRTVNGVSVQQRTASVSASGGKKFLRVKAEQAP